MDDYSLFLMTGIPHYPNHCDLSYGIFPTKRLTKKLGLRDQALVRSIQTMLLELGYREVGCIDGRPGPRFFAALAHYQRDHGIKGEL